MQALRAIVGTIGEAVIYSLIYVFGRRFEEQKIAWLLGPLGGPVIGDRSYEETADGEGLTLERNCRDGGLLPDFDALASPTFDPSLVDPEIRAFYEGEGDS